MRLVLLHGFGGSRGSFDELIGQLQPLIPGIETHAFPIAGHEHELEDVGSLEPDSISSASKDHSAFSAEVERLGTEIERLGRERVALLGYSLGGRLAMGVFASHPERFSTVMLCGAHPGLKTQEERRVRLLQDHQWAEKLRTGSLDQFFDEWQQQPLFDSQRQLPIMVLQKQRTARLRLNKIQLAKAMDAFSLGRMPDYEAVLRTSVTPILCLSGEHDLKFRQLAENWIQGCPTGRHIVLDGCGHNMVLEKPELLAQHVSQWLTHCGR